MKAEMRDEKTLVIIPESTAEMVVLKNMAGGKAEIEKPRPFAVNVDELVIKANETNG